MVRDRKFGHTPKRVLLLVPRHRRKRASLTLIIFFSLPRSQFHRDRWSSPTVGWVAGVCLSSLRCNSCGSEEAPLVLWGPADDHSTLLAPEAVVSGAPGVSGGRSGGSASGPGSFEPASRTSATSGSVKASSSCLETIQRFVKSCGFSRHVANQTALARRPSSRAGYQAKWSFYRRWCTSEGHSISRPSLPKIADFLFWLQRSKTFSVSAVMGYRSMLSAVFRSVLPENLLPQCFTIYCDLFVWKLLSDLLLLLRGIY